jgi:hypothetical protein
MTQANETLVFNAIEGDDVPGWKLLDTAIRGWIIKRQHDEQMENYANLKKANDAVN